MNIIFYCDSIPFHLESLTTHPLGGTESAVLSLSKELGKLGHNVTIIGQTQTYHTKGNVTFMPTHSTDMQYVQGDIFVTVRDPSIVNMDLSRFKKVIFWSQDVMQHPSMEHLVSNTQNVLDKIDHVVIMSDFVKSQIDAELNNELKQKIVIIRNGVDSDLVCEPNKESDVINCTYHSMPYRGLAYLLEMWPEIRRRFVNINLHLFTGDEIYGNKDQNAWMWNKARRLGIEVHGAVSQKELLENLARMDLHLYPTDFVESSCMAMMMSLASGCRVITTDLGALKEQINNKNGVLVSGHPGTSTYQEKFIRAIANMIILQEKQNINYESWADRAQQWLQLIERN